MHKIYTNISCSKTLCCFNLEADCTCSR